MTLKSWHAGVAVGLGALTLLGAFGFSSPSVRADRHEKHIADVRVDLAKEHDKNAEQDKDIAVMQRDIDYAARGIDALLRKEGLTPSPRRSGRR